MDSDDIVFTLIKDKLNDLKDISYTDIAHKAISIGKNNLAIKLLGNYSLHEKFSIPNY